MRELILPLIVASILFVSPAFQAQADKVYLKNGNVLEGIVQPGGGGTLKVILGGGMSLEVPQEWVSRIERKDAPEPAEVSPAASVPAGAPGITAPPTPQVSPDLAPVAEPASEATEFALEEFRKKEDLRSASRVDLEQELKRVQYQIRLFRTTTLGDISQLQKRQRELQANLYQVRAARQLGPAPPASADPQEALSAAIVRESAVNAAVDRLKRQDVRDQIQSLRQQVRATSKLGERGRFEQRIKELQKQL